MTLRDDINAKLPLSVDHVVINDPFVTLEGPGWILNINTEWTLSSGDALVVDSTEDDDVAMDAISRLRDEVWTRCEVDDSLHDPTFVFGEYKFQVVADTDLEPWVLHLEGLPVVLVGSGQVGSEQ